MATCEDAKEESQKEKGQVRATLGCKSDGGKVGRANHQILGAGRGRDR